jgi:hypothetical protein
MSQMQTVESVMRSFDDDSNPHYVCTEQCQLDVPDQPYPTHMWVGIGLVIVILIWIVFRDDVHW